MPHWYRNVYVYCKLCATLGAGAFTLSPHSYGNCLISPLPCLGLENRDMLLNLLRRAHLARHAHFLFVG
jgi:hypothetical protein